MNRYSAFGARPARAAEVGRPRAVLWTGLVVWAALAGCSRSPTHSVQVPPTDLSTPESTARSLLSTLQAEAAAVARRDHEAIDKARRQLVELAAAEEILERFPQKVDPDKRERAIREVTESWGAALSHYIDGARMEELRVPLRTEKAAHVLVPARAASDEALIRVECAAVNGVWRVTRVDFASENDRKSGGSAARPTTTTRAATAESAG